MFKNKLEFSLLLKMGTIRYRSIIVGVLLLIMVFGFVNGIYAITGSIGNARMILRPEVGETVEKSILVKNVNDVSVNIELAASGDLEDDITLRDTEFTLAPSEDRKAYFTIDVKDVGTSESKININFVPVDGGNTVGLSATVIVIPEGGEKKGFFDFLKGNDDDEDQEDQGVSFGQSGNNDAIEQSMVEDSDKDSRGILAFSGTVTIILFLALLILLYFTQKRIQKSGKIKPKKSSTK